MIKDKQYYEVRTHWGRFRLDEGAYQDYAQGRLWITWVPGKPQEVPISGTECLLRNVSEEAVRLRDEAEKNNAYALLQQLCPGEKICLPYKAKMKNVPIDELFLSVRSSNGLMRANAGTLGKVAELMEREQGLKSVRNLGVKSEQEIKRHFFLTCYSLLTQGERAAFWQSVLDERKQKTITD